jgi:transcriptional regulator of acetoin/glycerol metabolism
MEAIEPMDHVSPVEQRKPPLSGSRISLERAGPHPNPVRARTRFLEGELEDENVSRAEVRPPILDSWRRSRFFGVDADRIETPYNADFDPHSRLATAAGPVLDRLSDALHGTPMCLILTDSRGRVRERRTGDHALHRHLDEISLAPGFSYAEEYVGTNGIGTAAEEGRTSHVFGSEPMSRTRSSMSAPSVSAPPCAPS